MSNESHPTRKWITQSYNSHRRLPSRTKESREITALKINPKNLSYSNHHKTHHTNTTLITTFTMQKTTNTTTKSAH